MIKRFHNWIVGGEGQPREASRCKSAKKARRRLSLERMEARTLLSADFGGSIEQVMAEMEDADGGFVPVYEPATGNYCLFNELRDSCAVRTIDGESVRIENPAPQQTEVRPLILKDLLPPEDEGGMIDVGSSNQKPVFGTPVATNAPTDQGDRESESGGQELPAEAPLGQLVGEGSRGKSYAFEVAFAPEDALPRQPLPEEEARPSSPLRQVEPVSAADLPEIRPVPEVELPGHVQRSPVLRPHHAEQEPAFPSSETLVSQRAQPDPEPVGTAQLHPLAQDHPESGHGPAPRQQPELRPPGDVQARSVLAHEQPAAEGPAVGAGVRDAAFTELADNGAVRVDRGGGTGVVTFLATAVIGHRVIRRQANPSTVEGGTHQIPPKQPVPRNTDPSR